MLSRARKLAEIVAVALLTAMFAAFLLQIFMRYVLNHPLGWTSEACVILYIWTVFWTSAFLLDESDHVSFSMLSDAVSARSRRVLTIIGHVILGLAFASAFPAIVDYVSFMKIDSTPVTRIRFDVVYSIFPVFVVAVVIRSVLALYRAFRGRDDIHPAHTPEAL
ncbi:TRAP transporter small permease [Phyllobacterium salinisoli]|uniref:TRAP transporter small permease protein n=1 Tax=Phyllobacterium salinisoli TaxID=1899321 RepID=A0A368K640_9HYPH|nr:TRAP transporter small permease [Phyllobacterium salinisoli]RCS24847.1 TRAP transporter small permease [Phyllobacterium salinisoli]